MNFRAEPNDPHQIEDIDDAAAARRAGDCAWTQSQMEIAFKQQRLNRKFTI